MIEHYFKWFVEIVFSLGLFFNAFLFIPQAIKIYKTKDARGISIFTFAGFNVMQLFTALHGYLTKDYLLALGFILSLITCGVVTLLAIKYKKNKYL